MTIIQTEGNTEKKEKKKAGPLVPRVKTFVHHFTRLKTVKTFSKKMQNCGENNLKAEFILKIINNKHRLK